MGPGPFALPPKVNRPATPPPPPAIAATNTPAHLRPPLPAAITAMLPQQAVAPSDELTDTVTLLPVAVPAQRKPPLPPPPPPPARRRRRPPMRPALSLPVLVLVALATAFFAWVSAEPFWLAVGHGHTGTATLFVAPHGCRARFVADDGTFTVSTVAVAGLRGCPDGAAAPARMVSEHAAWVYATDQAGLNARWSIGFGLVILCGLAVAAATGSGRLAGWRGATAVGLSLAAPILVTAVMLAVTY